ncbi:MULTISPECIES: cytochrome P450 [Nocardia]|jgi:cytochrome P450|uniref:Cytochrome P450 n=1 Tax=Nocardia nova TaxID=37330 RepID=A0A2S6A5W9_9NOCA|nr:MULTISPECIES: cytochrome P450 [Nocardia]OBF64122.1 cytochrome [Mycobacterium sp. 852002-51759_SCH5129042]MBF6277987.1 cytochrome P450 [Nocardia nova]OBA55470.1 cytochrome [Nocardia sp. 852002-51101_SCH5132738]OBB49738.1 cytochrome [Nocardia sp. 852002-51244_SCH5132740]PPJ06657.1 cytochrome P450 [Nocardia nova]
MSTTETVTPTEYPFEPVPPKDAVDRYRAIAAERPMTKMTMPFGGDVWVIHRNAAAREMLSDGRFVREPFRTGERVVPYFVEFPDFLRTTLQFEDPPHHTKLRKLVQRSISPKRVKAMRDSAVEFANHLIDEMVAKGAPTNLVHDYAVALPIQMLANLLGVPPEDRPKFQKWSSATLAVANMPEEEVVANMTELVVYMMALIEERRKSPREDLLSDLANARDKDDSLTDGEILPIALVLIIGGFDNTANFICAGVLSLLRNPDQLELFLQDPDGMAPTAVEEILRHGRMALGDKVAGGGGLVPFVATEDVEIDGQLVARGEAVMVDPAAVAHDGVALEHDDVFDIRRSNNPHLTLSYGLHHCLGAPLARMEMQVGLAELFKRLPGLTLHGEAVVDNDNLTQPIVDLPVTW